MKLAEYRQVYAPEPKPNVLILLRRGDEILLAMKKRGFGAGKWNGPGGKVEPGESLQEAAARETHEEVGVKVGELKEVARLRFYFMPDSHGVVACIEGTVYMGYEWTGEPSESEEMAPQWYRIADIPYGEMWQDDQYWLPRVLGGEYVHGEFLFDDKDVMHDMVLKSERR